MKELPFTGFKSETFDFFKELKKNNNKEWFDEHKKKYEENVLNPLKALIVYLSPTMHAIDSMIELRPHRVISRIYRDVRFSKNKDPYKTCMWFTFQIPVSREDWKDYPGYFMEITAETYTLGMGLFAPKKKVMDSFREEIEYNSDEFRQTTQKTVLDNGFSIHGELYKRPLPNNLSEYYQQWIQRKGIWVGKTMPIGVEMFSTEVADQIKHDFQELKWLYEFMKECTLTE